VVGNVRKAAWKAWLPTYPEFDRWYRNMLRGSENTAEEQARALYRLCTKVAPIDPMALAEMGKVSVRDVENFLMDVVTTLEARRVPKALAPGTIHIYLKAAKAWLLHNGIVLQRTIHIKDVQATPRVDQERTPTQDELRGILNNASPRGRLIIGLMAMAGVRPMTVGTKRGDDGLRLRDLPELRIEGTTVVFDHVPTRVNVRKPLSKARHPYMTFIGREVCDYLKANLEARVVGGEALTPESALVRVTPGYEHHNREDPARQHIVARNLTKDVRKAMRPINAGRPYVLRTYFATRMAIAEGAGKVSHAYWQFWMGHRGDMAARYSTNRTNLPQEMVEDMRAAYKRCEPYLDTRQKQEAADPMLRLTEAVLKAGGVAPQAVAGLDLAGLDDGTMVKVLVDAMAHQMPSRASATPAAGPKPRQRVVSVQDLAELLEQGWVFRATVGADQAVVESIS
jgi:integrase